MDPRKIWIVCGNKLNLFVLFCSAQLVFALDITKGLEWCNYVLTTQTVALYISALDLTARASCYKMTQRGCI